MPQPVRSKYLTRLINQTLRSRYGFEEVEAMDPSDVEDILDLHDALVQRMNHAIKHPDFKKNPDAGLLGEILSQLL